MDFSLIVPCYNEHESIGALFPAIESIFNVSGVEYEVIFVDDGSRDETFGILRAYAKTRSNATVVSFSRNFGKESAIYAGLEHARGDVVGIIDADLQQDPATILEMYRYLIGHPEYECVAGVQEDRHEGSFLKWCKHRFYKTFNATSDDIDIIENASDFRVFRKQVRDALLDMPEYFRFSKGLFAWVGFATYSFPYTAGARYAGMSKWSFWHLMSYAINGLIAFSTKPLKLLVGIGSVASVAAVIYLIVNIVEAIAFGITTPGYPTIVCLILLFGGLIMLGMGIQGEYLARIYIEGKHRPIYIARAVITPDSLQAASQATETDAAGELGSSAQPQA